MYDMPETAAQKIGKEVIHFEDKLTASDGVLLPSPKTSEACVQ
jgi:hypothetical protein